MKKSVYSLVLMDDVIKEVDKEAYRLGTSRSNLVNQILAGHLSCVTPEMRMKEIFSLFSDMIGNSFQIQQQRSASLLTLRSSLEYKYRPTINYKVELARSTDDGLGLLRVRIRTQSEDLISLFNRFFVYRAEFEAKCLSERGCDGYRYELSSGSFTRRLINYDEPDEQQIASAISSYITLLDRTVKKFFSDPDGFESSARELENEYRQQLEKSII